MTDKRFLMGKLMLKPRFAIVKFSHTSNLGIENEKGRDGVGEREREKDRGRENLPSNIKFPMELVN